MNRKIKIILTSTICLLLSVSVWAMDLHPKNLALDSEYRNKYETYHLSNGMIKDSREINWREVEWEQVVKVCVHIRNRETCIDDTNKAGFKGFMNFRWTGRKAVTFGKQHRGYVTIDLWTIGWTDGAKAYLQDIDFRTGEVVKKYTMDLSCLKSHIHPRLELNVE